MARPRRECAKHSRRFSKPARQERHRIHTDRRHGTVDNSGAYILTYDSDPENLAKTALPMAELHTLVEDETGQGRPCDFPRRRIAAGHHRRAENGVARQRRGRVGEAPGEMLD